MRSNAANFDRSYFGWLGLDRDSILHRAFYLLLRNSIICEGFCVCVVRHVMSLNSVQSFVIENCNGPTTENGLNNVCLHPLSLTFTFNPRHMLLYYAT